MLTDRWTSELELLCHPNNNGHKIIEPDVIRNNLLTRVILSNMKSLDMFKIWSVQVLGADKEKEGPECQEFDFRDH